MPRASLSVLLLFGLLGLAACDQPRAQGDANAVIVVAATDLWLEAEDDFRAHMEPTVQTVREEPPFRITHFDPDREDGWGQLRRFQQLVVLGSADTPWVAEALEAAEDPVVEAPGVLEVENVWARGQRVWVMLLPDGEPAAQVGELAGDVFERLSRAFHDYARRRMYTSGRDSVLADSLSANVGFSLQLPNVYRYEVEGDVFRFRNDNPSPTELIREVAVTWWEPAPDEVPTREELEEWRLQLTRDHYVDPQDLDTTVVSYQPIQVDGASGIEYRSAWMSPPDAWPAGGPVIIRALECPDQNRMYVMDAWVYAPNRDKYEYVLQLETILDSFRCR